MMPFLEILENLSLESVSGSWAMAWSQGTISKALNGCFNKLESFLCPFLATSYFARCSSFLSLFSVCLLLFLSPFVGTGINAVLVFLAFTCMLFDRLVNPPAEPSHPALLLPFFFLIATTLVAAGASPYLAASLKGLAKLAVYWLAFAAFLWNLRGKKAAYLIGALFAAVLLESLYGVYQYHIRVAPLALWEDADASVQLIRVFGTLRNPNLLAGYLLPVIPMALTGFFLVSNKLLKAFSLCTGCLAILCLGFTFSRGAYVGLLVEVVYLAVLGGSLLLRSMDAPKRKWLLLGGVLGAAMLFLALFNIPGIHDRLLSIVATREHSSNSFRLNVWSAVFHMIRDNWIFGIGVGNAAFTKAYPLYMVSGFEALAAYNIFLEAMVEGGILGLLSFFLLVFAAWSRTLLFFVKGPEKFWAAALGASLLGMMAHGMVDTVFFRPSVQLLFWLVLALIIRLGERSPA